MAENTPPPTTRYRMSKLPRELRDEIWKLALAPDTDDGKDTGANSSAVWIDRRRKTDTFAYRPPAPLNAVCRQIRHDVMDTYLSHKRFHYRRADIAIAWLKALPFDSRAKVTALYCSPCPHGIDGMDKPIEKACSQWLLQCKMFQARGIDAKDMIHICRGMSIKPSGVGRFVGSVDYFTPEELQPYGPIVEAKAEMKKIEMEKKKKMEAEKKQAEHEKLKTNDEWKERYSAHYEHYVAKGWNEELLRECGLLDKLVEMDLNIRNDYQKLTQHSSGGLQEAE